MSNKLALKIRAKRIKKVEIEDADGTKDFFTLRGIPAQTVLDNYSLFDSIDEEKVDIDTKNLSKKERDYIEKKIAPIMKVCLPDCCIEPRIVLDEKDPLIVCGDAINIKDLSVVQMMGLFEHVFEMAGFSKKEEDKRKNLLRPALAK